MGAAVERGLEAGRGLPLAPDGAAEGVGPGGGKGGVVLLAREEGRDVGVGVRVTLATELLGAALALLPRQMLGHLACNGNGQMILCSSSPTRFTKAIKGI